MTVPACCSAPATGASERRLASKAERFRPAAPPASLLPKTAVLARRAPEKRVYGARACFGRRASAAAVIVAAEPLDARAQAAQLERSALRKRGGVARAGDANNDVTSKALCDL